MPTLTRRLVPVVLAGFLLVPLAAPVGAWTQEPVTEATLVQSGLDLVTLTNRQRASLGLVALRLDPALMQIARARADAMAATDVMSHTEPNGQNAFDRLNAAGITWFGAGEIIAWNHYPTEPLSVAESISAWMASPGHHAIIVSTGYNYVGFGAAVSATGKRFYAGIFVKEPDHTPAWARFGTTSTSAVDGGHKRVTVRWSGADIRLQVLTAGLRSFELQWRAAGGAWHAWGTTIATRKSATWTRGVSYDVRVRAVDRAGNRGAWRTIHLRV